MDKWWWQLEPTFKRAVEGITYGVPPGRGREPGFRAALDKVTTPPTETKHGDLKAD